MDDRTSFDGRRVLLVGATGFVGERTYPALVEAGFDVVCAARDVERASRKHPDWRWVQLDLDDRTSIAAALAGVDRAVYLAHAMAAGDDYPKVERRQAEAFRDLASRRHLARIVYLGGMPPRDAASSKHLLSRLATGEVLRSGAVSTVELRATMILGGGSESFRIVRDLAARLPWMLLPKWLDSESEPVAISDVAAAVVRALELPLPDGESRIYSAPGPDRLSGRRIILRTAELMGQHPRAWSVPVVTPRLSSYWIRLVTRANPRVASELVEGLRSDVVTEGRQIWSEMPEHRRLSFDEAVRQALGEEARTLGPGSRLFERLTHRLASA